MVKTCPFEKIIVPWGGRSLSLWGEIIVPVSQVHCPFLTTKGFEMKSFENLAGKLAVRDEPLKNNSRVFAMQKAHRKNLC